MTEFITQVVLDNKIQVKCKRADESDVFVSDKTYSSTSLIVYIFILVDTQTD